MITGSHILLLCNLSRIDDWKLSIITCLREAFNSLISQQYFLLGNITAS